MAKNIDNTNLGYLKSKMDDTYWPKTDVVPIGIDSTPTANSNNLVKSGGVKDYVDSAVPSSINDLSDVTTGTPTDGDVLTYDSTTGKWGAEAPSGGGAVLSTDVVTDKTDNTKASTPKSVYDFVKPATGSSIPGGGLLPGVKYHLGTLSGSVTMALATAGDASVENEYKGDFTAASTAPDITWQGVTEWAGNCLDENTGLPVLTGGKHYEFNIENGYGLIVEFGV